MIPIYSRLGAWCGILLPLAWAPILLVVSDLPALDSERAITRFLHEDTDTLKLVIASVSAGFFLYLGFLGALTERLHASGRGGSLTWMALASGVMFMTLFNAALGLEAAANLTFESGTAPGAYVLHTAAFVLAAPAAFAGVAFFVAIAALALAVRIFPLWLGWLAGLAAVVNAGALGGIFSASGALNSGNGLLGGIVVPVSSWVLWIFAASLWMRRPRSAPIAQ
jgi:hypothetical protein